MRLVATPLRSTELKTPPSASRNLREIEIRRTPEGVAVGLAEEARAEAEALDGLRLRPETGLACAAALGQIELVREGAVGLDGVMQRLVEDGALGASGSSAPGHSRKKPNHSRPWASET